jgi:hypothetical protein
MIWRSKNFLPYRDSNSCLTPARAARSQSLYRLSYPEDKIIKDMGKVKRKGKEEIKKEGVQKNKHKERKKKGEIREKERKTT